MYINRGTLLKFILLAQRLFIFINKHFYIVLIISTILQYTNNRFYKVFIWLFKIFILLNIIFGLAYILYLSISLHSFTSGLALYLDLMTSYINNLINTSTNLWNDLINIEALNNGWNKDQINQISKIKDQFDQIASIKDSLKSEVKESVKDSLKEVVFEALDKMHDEELENKNSNLKMVLIGASVAFVLYFFFILPGPGGDPAVIDTYNVINQTLINSKTYIKDLFDTVKDIHNNGPIVDPVNPIVDPVNVHPSLPGVVIDGISPASSSTITPTTPRSPGFSHYFREVKTPTVNSSSLPGTVIDGISPASSAASSPSTPKGYNVYFAEDKTPTVASSSLPTVTEAGSSNISPILSNIKDTSIQTDIIPLVNKGTQTIIDGISISKNQELLNLLEINIDPNNVNDQKIVNYLNNKVKTIID